MTNFAINVFRINQTFETDDKMLINRIPPVDNEVHRQHTGYVKKWTKARYWAVDNQLWLIAEGKLEHVTTMRIHNHDNLSFKTKWQIEIEFYLSKTAYGFHT